MKLRSIPPRTCITLARERKFTPVVRKLSLSKSFDVIGKRGGMRPQISRKPFEEKLSQLQDELNELLQFELEGFNISKLKNEIEEQMVGLLQLLGNPPLSSQVCKANLWGRTNGSRKSEGGRRKEVEHESK